MITALGVAAVSIIIVVYAWRFNYSNLIETRLANVKLTGELIIGKFETEIEGDIQILENLKARIEETNGDYFDYWEFDAELIRSQNTSFKFVEWIDSDMIIQRINPLEGNEEAIGLDIGSLDYRREDWLRHMRDTTTNVTQWLNLVQGYQVFIVDEPLYFGGDFHGSISAGLNFTEVLNVWSQEYPEYYITIKDEQGTRFYESGDTAGIENYRDYTFLSSIGHRDLDTEWTFEMVPNRGIINQSVFQRLDTTLYVGLLFSILFSVALFFILESRSKAKSLIELNESQLILNAKLEEEKKKAESASNAKTEFLSNMSHEIRTPLSAIMGLIDIMGYHKLDELTRKYLGMLEISSKNLLSLVNNILDLDKIESGKMELAIIDFRPKLEIESLVELHKPSFEEKGLYLELEDEGFPATEVQGDPGKFAQVLNNLIRNAFKFTETGGLKILAEGNIVNKHLKIKLTLTDTGIGIPEEKQEFIFERFTQIDSGISKKFEGSGLGLSITQRILQLMGGSIKLESEPKKGTAFYIEVSFPVKTAKLEEEGQRKSVPSYNDYSGFRALIVDDIMLNQIVLQKVLERYKIGVDKAEDGEVAVKKARSNNYDIIFMDIHMPKKDGFEAAREIRNMGIQVPIVTLSANVTQDAMDKAREAGMQEYITKPFTNWNIQSVLKSHLSRN